MTLLRILYEDNHLLVVDKPSGLATMGAESGPTVHSLVGAYIKRAYHKPGNVFVGIVSRLDAMTSGVLVVARTSKAAARLGPQFSSAPPSGRGSHHRASSPAIKTYLAMVAGHLDQTRGSWVDHVWKDDAAKRMRVVGGNRSESQVARLHYVVLAKGPTTSLVAVRLQSGRKHQIRLQFAERGHAILGDRKYGSTARFRDGIALHSYQLQVTHPTRGEVMTWSAEPPPAWQERLKTMGLRSSLAKSVAEADADWRSTIRDSETP